MKPAPLLATALTALLGVTTIVAAQPNNEGTLQAAVSVPSGFYPYSVAIGDFNGDGVPDAAVANLGVGVSVLLGNGDGTFRSPVRYAAGPYPYSVVLGDLNGDLRVDLVVGQISDGIAVVLGNGDGTFRAPAFYPAGRAPARAAIGDFDGDGAMDIAAGSSTGGVGVLLNNGDGTFREGPVGTDRMYPWSLVAADFNGDGRQDLAIASNGGGGTTVLPGNGDGTFGAASFHITRGGTEAATGDFNGDGLVDLAVASTSDTGVSVLVGRGDGTFEAEARHGPNLRAMALAAGDLDGDGLDDLVAATYEYREKTGWLEHGELAVLLAGGGGSFLPAVHYAAGNSPRAIAVGDVDADGRADVIVANALSFDISVLLNGPVTQWTSMHVANLRAHAQRALDGIAWNAQVLVRTERADHRALPGTIVTGTWTDGSVSSCVTNSKGTCVVTRMGIAPSVAAITFTVTGLDNPAYPEHAYAPTANHDPDGDSDGTAIPIVNPGSAPGGTP